MKRFWSAPLYLAVFVISSAGDAKTACARHELGQVPWGTSEIMPGDQWAWVYLDIDKDGTPLGCRMGASNMSGSEGRSNVCRSFVSNWRAVPVLRDGKPVRTTIERYFIAMGDKHAKAEREARKRFFLDHPDERPECYRD